MNGHRILTRVSSLLAAPWAVVLPPSAATVSVLAMYTISRLMQLAGLTIPPLAIIAQLNERISLAQMLGFLVVAMAVFGIGRLLQRYCSGSS